MDGTVAFRESVPLGLVRPSETNPREDMGDIDALARSIEATGGQPVSPIVVVPDGGVYRIVDGERRYRALVSLGADRAECVVVDGYDEADELVAMMATDDKKCLTADERARGTQRMLRLDVPEGRAAGALGSTEERVRRARRVVREAPEQASLETMLAAADDSFSEEERRRVLSRSNAADAEREAGRIRKGHAAAEAASLIREGLGSRVTFEEGEAPTWDPESRGLLYLGTVSGPHAVAKVLAKAPEGAEIAAYPRQCGRPGYELFCSDPEADGRKAAMAEAKRRMDELSGRYVESFSGMAEWLAQAVAQGGVRPRPRGSDPFLDGVRRWGWGAEVIFTEKRLDALARDTPWNAFELAHALEMRFAGVKGLFDWKGNVNGRVVEDYACAFDWCKGHGWAPTPEDEALREELEGCVVSKDAEQEKADVDEG